MKIGASSEIFHFFIVSAAIRASAHMERLVDIFHDMDEHFQFLGFLFRTQMSRLQLVLQLIDGFVSITAFFLNSGIKLAIFTGEIVPGIEVIICTVGFDLVHPSAATSERHGAEDSIYLSQ